MITNGLKAKIIQFLFNRKSKYGYIVTRQSGKVRTVDNLFCLRKRNPENIVRIERFLRIRETGIIDAQIGKTLGVSYLGCPAYFLGFDDKKNSLMFKWDSDWDGYYTKHLPVREAIQLMQKEGWF